ncbi:MAG TPA: VOC family protein, partial [Gemmatimonadaceae bacterium]|nr:VOC family protein [Gemmatimonadaceae bacterium]
VETEMLGDRNALATIAVSDIEVARKFYEETLGFQHKGPRRRGVLAYSSGATTFLVYASQYAGTNQATSASWDAGDDMDSIVKTLRTKGVTFEHYYDMPDTTLEGDIHVSGGMRTAWFKDPDGNILNLFSSGEK